MYIQFDSTDSVLTNEILADIMPWLYKKLNKKLSVGANLADLSTRTCQRLTEIPEAERDHLLLNTIIEYREIALNTQRTHSDSPDWLLQRASLIEMYRAANKGELSSEIIKLATQGQGPDYIVHIDYQDSYNDQGNVTDAAINDITGNHFPDAKCISIEVKSFPDIDGREDTVGIKRTTTESLKRFFKKVIDRELKGSEDDSNDPFKARIQELEAENEKLKLENDGLKSRLLRIDHTKIIEDLAKRTKPFEPNKFPYGPKNPNEKPKPFTLDDLYIVRAIDITLDPNEPNVNDTLTKMLNAYLANKTDSKQ